MAAGEATGVDARRCMRRRAAELGAGEILLTSMDRDGTKDGYDLELTRTIANAVSIPVIASGGVGNLQHLIDGVLIGHANAVLAASIFHFGEYLDRRGQGGHARGRGSGARAGGVISPQRTDVWPTTSRP